MRTHSFETSFAAFGDNRLHCAAATPNPMVKRTEIADCIAPVKGTMSSEKEILIARRSPIVSRAGSSFVAAVW